MRIGWPHAPARRGKRAPSKPAPATAGRTGPPAGEPEIQPWRYVDRAPRATGRARVRQAAHLAAIPFAAAALLAVAAGWPSAAAVLGGAATVGQGELVPTWTVPAAFVHPGFPVAMTGQGRVVAVATEGVVAAGAPLVNYVATDAPVRPAGLPAWARWDGGRAQVRPAPAGWVWTRRTTAALGVCLRRACSGSAAAPERPGPLQVRSPDAGWYYPGWDPLAAVPAGAWSDLPPGVVLDAPVTLERGTWLLAGAPAGVLGSQWSGVWFLDLPEDAAAALAAASSARVSWPAGTGMVVHLVRIGPTVAGRFVAAFAADAPGPAPGPPPRTTATLTLAPVTGQLVPSSALLPGSPAVAVVSAAGRVLRTPVHVLATSPDWAAVSGLPAGARALVRPWLVRPWLAGSG